MEQFVLTDAQWAKMEPHCLGKPTDPGRSGSDNRRFVEAVLWIARTGSPWRDLPLFFGNWNISASIRWTLTMVASTMHPRRALPMRLDAELYKWRHLIENFFCKLKEFKRIAMRADKTDQSFAAIIHLAAAVINSR